jgi:hypothetical protein
VFSAEYRVLGIFLGGFCFVYFFFTHLPWNLLCRIVFSAGFCTEIWGCSFLNFVLFPYVFKTIV